MTQGETYISARNNSGPLAIFQPILLYIFNGMATNNLQNVLSSKNGQPISDPYFYHWLHNTV